MGVNRKAVLATLKVLGVEPARNARAQLCVTLADQLDQAPLSEQPVNVAAIAKELRLAIGELERSVSQVDSGLSSFLAELSSPVRNAEV